jgi:hypothetical protein
MHNLISNNTFDFVMALTKYKEKRNFKESPEPTGGSPDSEQLRFVIQKQLTEKFSIEK